MTPQSPSKVWGTLGPHTVFPITISCPVAPSHFAESHWRSEISSLSKVISVLGKARSHTAPNLGSSGAESPEWFDVSPENCMRCDTWTDMLLWWSCVISCWCEKCKFDTDSSLYLLSHFECDGHTVHMLTQWFLPPPLTSTVKSSLFTHAYSSPLSLTARLHWCHTNCSHCIENS